MQESAIMPFSAVAGNQTAKTAVLCLLVNPNLKSLLLNGATGTGKTTIVRSIESLDPDMPVVNVPIGATEDRLFGSINLEKAVTSGKMEAEKGLFGEESSSKPEIKEKCEDGVFLPDFWKCKR